MVKITVFMNKFAIKICATEITGVEIESDNGYYSLLFAE